MMTHRPPDKAVNIIINKLFEHGIIKKITLAENKVLYPMQNKCLYFSRGSGYIYVSQKNPNLNFGAILDSYPVGLIELYFPSRVLQYKTRGCNEIFQVNYSDWLRMVESQNISAEVFELLSYYTVSLLENIRLIYNESSYNTVVNLTIRCYENILNGRNLDETLVMFITSRSNLSRSTVLGIISDLKKSRNIELKSGFLIKASFPFLNKIK